MTTRTDASDLREHGHELLDAGYGRRLERFGALVVDRPAPSVEGIAPGDPAAWRSAAARYDEGVGRTAWSATSGTSTTWEVTFDGLALELRLAPSGQVGLFPEHAAGARWLAGKLAGEHAGDFAGKLAGDFAGELAGEHAGKLAGEHATIGGATVLNLFAYTGLATLTLAREGVAVVHVDASRATVGWARRNAELSRLDGAPIRWIVDDAAAFVRREVRRGRTYDAIVLDPPSYGHGPRGETWVFEDGLAELLADVKRLLRPRACLLVTAHTTGVAEAWLRKMVAEAIARPVESGPLELVARSGVRLSLGAYARIAPDRIG